VNITWDPTRYPRETTEYLGFDGLIDLIDALWRRKWPLIQWCVLVLEAGIWHMAVISCGHNRKRRILTPTGEHVCSHQWGRNQSTPGANAVLREDGETGWVGALPRGSGVCAGREPSGEPRILCLFSFACMIICMHIFAVPRMGGCICYLIPMVRRSQPLGQTHNLQCRISRYRRAGSDGLETSHFGIDGTSRGAVGEFLECDVMKALSATEL
jgi:hypothetical protein